jgi:hypothetical protein
VEGADFVKKNDPKEFGRVKSGKTTVKAAERKVRTAKKSGEQQAAEAEKQRMAKLRRALGAAMRLCGRDKRLENVKRVVMRAAELLQQVKA